MLIFEGVKLVQGTFTLTADFTVPNGLTAVIGPSGGGKSTLLNAVAGFLAPQTGRITWKGRDLTPHDPGARPVSMLFQDNNLFPHLTVAQNVGLAMRPNLRLTSDDKAAVAQALARVGLEGYADRKPGALSGGQQSRVALARILVADRPLVMLDEAFSALGPAMKDEMLDLVQTMLVAAGKTVLMVTHDPQDALRVADHVVLVADGAAAAPLATATIFDAPPPALKAYLG